MTTRTGSVPPVPHVHELDFDAEVLASDRPVLVDFTAPWCGPCRVLDPILAELAVEEAARAKIVAVDGDESPGLAARFGIRGYPTVIAFAGGKEVGRQLGVATKDKLRRLLPA